MGTVQWGVIGAGGIADRRTIPGMMGAKNMTLIAVMDISKEATDRVAAQYGVAKKYYTVEDLLNDGDVDAVYIATPAYLHHDQAMAAANAGKHILLEKPLALTSKDGEEIVATCRRRGVKLTEGYMMKFHALHQRAKEIVEKELLGNLVMGRAQLSCWYPDIPGAWRQDPALGGGGALIDMATHCYDLLRLYMGKITEVFAFTNTQTFRYPVEDSSTTLLRFESGAHGVVDCFFNVPDAAGQDRLELYGNKGSVLAEGTIGQTGGGHMVAYLSSDAKAYDPQQSKTSLDVKVQEIAAKEVNPYTAEVEYLSDCILKDVEPTMNTGEEGLEIVRIVEAAYESGQTGKVVALQASSISSKRA